MNTPNPQIQEQVENAVEYSNFYYLRHDNGQPFGTVVLGKKDGVISRGISVCSVEDEFDRSQGYKLAAVRMLRAFKHQSDSDEICEMSSRLSYELVCKLKSMFKENKSGYNVETSTHEDNILKFADPIPVQS